MSNIMVILSVFIALTVIGNTLICTHGLRSFNAFREIRASLALLSVIGLYSAILTLELSPSYFLAGLKEGFVPKSELMSAVIAMIYMITVAVSFIIEIALYFWLSYKLPYFIANYWSNPIADKILRTERV